MTAQASDGFYLDSVQYAIAAIQNEWPFDPVEHGFKPVAPHTGCWRGSDEGKNPHPDGIHRQTYQAPSLPSSGGSPGGKWMLGIAAVIGVLWLTGDCLAEDIRMDGAKSAGGVNNSMPPVTVASRSNAKSPKFFDFPAEEYLGIHARVVLTSRDMSFRTRLRNSFSAPIDFAGEYTLAIWGCGAECLVGAAISKRTGKVVWLPGTVCCWRGDGGNIIYRPDSRLIVLAGIINEKGDHAAHFYELRDNDFVPIMNIPIPDGNTE
jgi:hypothetical protein